MPRTILLSPELHRLGARLVEIWADTSPLKNEDLRPGIQAELAFMACERYLGTRKVEKVRAVMNGLGFCSKACLGEFREYYRKNHMAGGVYGD